ncbi:hypothetical protein AAF712_010158 [Marasmius tenuissimus]|uniref:Uncharacterized protein n=1 Tax=Marasmius tenuissimus TaxID=585030 RepID=A0ABR2ZRD7_9AGAR
MTKHEQQQREHRCDGAAVKCPCGEEVHPRYDAKRVKKLAADYKEVTEPAIPEDRSDTITHGSFGHSAVDKAAYCVDKRTETASTNNQE